MNEHQRSVLKFHLSYEAGMMTRKQVDERVRQMREQSWREHLNLQKPDGTCRAGCPLHAKKRV